MSGAWGQTLGLMSLPLPTCGSCSSEQSARARTQKELMTALRELKLRLPPERRGKGRSGTLATLQYALACVKQVQGEWCFLAGCGQGMDYCRGPFSLLKMAGIPFSCS